ncbi:hypothetical protein BRADI_5g26375v3 [Brachypodium distachyon]|uniref:Uncharacterized protein n=1 Tax=Brachypodium distachyon TaxID=15368 RepID=A0A0Q3KZ24_BRADI|nr:hypothetical protein BRADI_5g26375v3 [Brachypodium distachyon]
MRMSATGRLQSDQEIEGCADAMSSMYSMTIAIARSFGLSERKFDWRGFHPDCCAQDRSGFHRYQQSSTSGCGYCCLGYQIGTDTISVTSGVVSRIEMQSYVHGSTELLGLQVLQSPQPFKRKFLQPNGFQACPWHENVQANP